MSVDTLRAAARRIREHLDAHNKKDYSIIFHGGEPLMVGPKKLEQYFGIIDDILPQTQFNASYGMQTNLMLFNETFGDLLKAHNCTLGVSLDGPPEINDRRRVDHHGRGTAERVLRALNLLTSPNYRELFSGLLAVMDVNSDPRIVLPYLLQFRAPKLNFLLPLENHNTVEGKRTFADVNARYGSWLSNAFDIWLQTDGATRISYFDNLIGLLCGGASSLESIGAPVVDLIVIATDGSIEAVDSLKSAYDGATHLGYTVLNHKFDEVARDIQVQIRQQGLAQLCSECSSCEIRHVCGGGYYPHRYSKLKGFMNPSVYCADIKLITEKIKLTLDKELRSLTAPLHAAEELGTARIA
jgi:uncharacterized protein